MNMFPELNDSSRKIQPKCGPILGLFLWILVVFSSKVFSKSMILHCIFHDKSAHFNHGSSMIVHALNVLLSGASPKHSPHPAGCFPGLLVSYFWLRNQALTWGNRGVYSQNTYNNNLWPLSWQKPPHSGDLEPPLCRSTLQCWWIYS